MACPSPLTITRDMSSFRLDNPDRPVEGDSGVYFDVRSGVHRVQMSVPCGSCESCYAARASQWAIRCYCESLSHEKVSFITLTYDDDHLPADGRLVKADLQKFFKRLRKKVSIRYFACGEYGDQFRRPHYHAIIFGADFLGDAYAFEDSHFISPDLSALWGLGLATTCSATYSTICYVTGYVAKKIGDPDCFQLMSRRPGLGQFYISSFEDDLRRTGAIQIEGREYPLPSYFFTQEDFDDLKKARRAAAAAVPTSWQSLNSRSVNAAVKSTRKRGVL